jgi:hypothetical protein
MKTFKNNIFTYFFYFLQIEEVARADDPGVNVENFFLFVIDGGTK